MIVYEENNLQMNYNNKKFGCKANVYKCVYSLLLHNKLPTDKYLFSHSDPRVSEREIMRVEAIVFL